MMDRIVKVIALPTLKGLLGSALWGGLLYSLWTWAIKSPKVLNDRFLSGKTNAEVNRLLNTVHDDVGPVILFMSISLAIWLFLWFLRCSFHDPLPGKANALKSNWIIMGLLMILSGAGMAYWFGFSEGRLGSLLSTGTIIYSSIACLFIMLAGWWLISFIATNKGYKPSATFL